MWNAVVCATGLPILLVIGLGIWLAMDDAKSKLRNANEEGVRIARDNHRK